MSDKPTVIQHNGVSITYSRSGDTYTFTVNGRERTCKTLQKAMETIDNPSTTDKKNAFPRTKCFQKASFGEGWVQGDVTSLIADTWGEGFRECWFVRDGNRSKEYLDHIYPVNEHNAQLIEQIKQLEDEVATLCKRKNALTDKLHSLKSQIE